MKNNFLLILVFTPLLSFGQDSSEDDKYFHYNYSTPGMHLLNDAINIKYSSRKDNNPNYRYANSIRSSIERDLLSSARMQVRQHLKEQKTIMSIRKSAFAKESMLASAWSSSRTGITSGKSWYELLPEEREFYADRYITYFQGPVQTTEREFSMAWGRSKRGQQDDRSWAQTTERELSMAWGRSKRGQQDGRSWTRIPEREKKHLRSNYIARKAQGLLPKNPTSIPQEEYQKAYLVMRSGDKDWDQLSSFEKSSFRHEYSIAVRYDPSSLLALK
jgi:hypothetical protein